MISSQDMRILEDNSAYHGVSKLQLMENAGEQIAKYMLRAYPKKKVLFICGHGNNGGDGFAAARMLKAKVLFVGKREKLRGEAQVNYQMLSNEQFIYDIKEIKNYAVLVDGVIGTGMSGPLKAHYKKVIQKMNASRKQIVSIDIPSGMHPDKKTKTLHVKAHMTLTFHDIKATLNPKKTRIVSIGIPKEAADYIGVGELRLAHPERKKNTRKGKHGKILIVGGSKEYSGAPILSALAIGAFRAGLDWVTVACPKVVADAISKQAPDVVVKRYECDFFEKKHATHIVKLAKRFDCVLIGPGIGKQAHEFVKRIIKEIKKPKVIDADAIKALSISHISNAIITPHKRELDIFMKNSKINAIKNLQKKLKDNVVLLKGPTDKVISKELIKINKTGTASMAKAGTGDVLAGLCAAFLAQSNDKFNSACAAAFINGLCGEEIEQKVGEGYLSSEMTRPISQIIQKLLNKNN